MTTRLEITATDTTEQAVRQAIRQVLQEGRLASTLRVHMRASNITVPPGRLEFDCDPDDPWPIGGTLDRYRAVLVSWQYLEAEPVQGGHMFHSEAVYELVLVPYEGTDLVLRFS